MRRPCPLLLLSLATCTRTGTVGVIGGDTDGATSLGTDDDGDDGSGEGSSLDLPDGGIDVCTARGPMGGVGPCMPSEQPSSFVAEVQWSWSGAGEDTDTRVIPLVANLTDDNGDGVVDLCDGPDIVVTAGPPPSGNPMTEFPPDARLYALDGATGSQHWVGQAPVRAMITPALADLDDDGLVEIVTLQASGAPNGELVPSVAIAFASDGSVKWISDAAFDAPASDAVAIADLDADGEPEILVADRVFDRRGQLVFAVPEVVDVPGEPLMPTAADLDGDGDLEAVWSRGAFHHDGTPVYTSPMVQQGYVQIANLDMMPGPEIIVTTARGISVLAPDGTQIVDGATPAGPPVGVTWRRPAAIHDINGDRRPEILIGLGSTFHAFRLDVTGGVLDPVYTVPIDDPSGAAAGTAFDFLGDSTAEGIFADERLLYVYEETRSEPSLTADRSSVTVQEYPVVADVDNDGSAEIVVGSTRIADGTADPTIRVFGEATSRWVQARRIWNQHTYHVTNIGETGKVPAPEPPSWERTNTFRTNAQIEGGVVCLPEP